MGYIKHKSEESVEDYLETILVPVSYTHLDVYKRQLQAFLSFFPYVFSPPVNLK